MIGVGNQRIFSLALLAGSLLFGNAMAAAGGAGRESDNALFSRQIIPIMESGQSGAKAQWGSLGSGVTWGSFPGFIYTMTVYDGDLIAGGTFRDAGDTTAMNIARWDGAGWAPLDAISGDVYAVALFEGDLITGGAFLQAGDTPATYIARWDGTSWSALGSGLNGVVFSLATLPNGDLVAGGVFTAAGGGDANHIARWNGSSWAALGRGRSGSCARNTGRRAALPSHAVPLPHRDRKSTAFEYAACNARQWLAPSPKPGHDRGELQNLF